MSDFPDFLSGGAVSPGGASQVVERNAAPGFAMTCQEETQWCWAAVAQAVENVFGVAVSQSAIASDHVSPGSATPACARPLASGALAKCGACASGCAQPHSLTAILRERGRLGADGAKSGVPSFAEIKAWIDGGKPLPVRIYWGGNQGHFVCVAGYKVLADGAQWVTVYDPLLPGVAGGAAEAQDMRYGVFAAAYPSTDGSKGCPSYYYEVT